MAGKSTTGTKRLALDLSQLPIIVTCVTIPAHLYCQRTSIECWINAVDLNFGSCCVGEPQESCLLQPTSERTKRVRHYLYRHSVVTWIRHLSKSYWGHCFLKSSWFGAWSRQPVEASQFRGSHSKRRCQPWQMSEHINSPPKNRSCLEYVIVNLHTHDIKVQGKTSSPIVVSARWHSGLLPSGIPTMTVMV